MVSGRMIARLHSAVFLVEGQTHRRLSWGYDLRYWAGYMDALFKGVERSPIGGDSSRRHTEVHGAERPK
jgi:hypothetical protein